MRGTHPRGAGQEANKGEAQTTQARGIDAAEGILEESSFVGSAQAEG